MAHRKKEREEEIVEKIKQRDGEKNRKIEILKRIAKSGLEAKKELTERL